MIEKLIEVSIRNRFLVLILAGALAAWAVYAVLNTPVDAIPDLSENQVIVFTDWMGRSPQEIEDQVTYPLSLKLQGLAGVKAVRSQSEFNFSMITLIFEDQVGFYFARQRVLERLTVANTFLPEGVTPYLAPDATALGQIFWYTLDGGDLDPGQRWALQKYYVGPEINSVPGVAEVGTVGGMPFEYQIDVDPNDLRAYGVTLGELYDAIARSNSAVGGRTIEKNRAEYLVRGVGWIKDVKDIEDTVIDERGGTPVYVKNVAAVQLGTQFRRSVFEKDGSEAVGAAVLMRHGENPLAVTERIKAKIQELQSGLPPGVHIVPAYDRTRLIRGAIDTLTGVSWIDVPVPWTGYHVPLPWPEGVMWHEMMIAAAAVMLILMHFRSVFVICVTLLLSVLFAFLMMWLLRVLHILDVQANIMSLAGITISIGILVDQAIVMVENATHHLKEQFGDKKVRGDTRETVIRACRTVGRPIFFSVLIMLISFIPVFAMSGREGKLFHPLAFTKSFALVGVALISVTVVPALIPTFIRGRLRREDENWIVRSFINIYKPVLTWALPRRNLVMWAFAVLLILAAGMFPLQAILGLGGSILYWRICFFVVLFVVVAVTVVFTVGFPWQVLSFFTPGGAGTVGLPLPQDRRGVHAAPERGHGDGHADHRAAGQRHRGGRRPQGARRPLAQLPGGRVGHRQGGPGRHADRPGAAGHGGDVRELPAQGALAQAGDEVRRRGPADAGGAGRAGGEGLRPAGPGGRPRRPGQRRGHERPVPLRRGGAVAGRGALPGLRDGPGPDADALHRGGDGAPASGSRRPAMAGRGVDEAGGDRTSWRGPGARQRRLAGEEPGAGRRDPADRRSRPAAGRPPLPQDRRSPGAGLEGESGASDRDRAGGGGRAGQEDVRRRGPEGGPGQAGGDVGGVRRPPAELGAVRPRRGGVHLVGPGGGGQERPRPRPAGRRAARRRLRPFRG